MTELLNSYDSDLEKLLSQIASHIKSVPSEGSSKVEKDIHTAKTLIKQMNIEIQSITNAKQKGEFKTKVNYYKKQVEKFEQELKKSSLLQSTSASCGENDHFGFSSSSSLNEDEYKQRMLHSTQVLTHSSKTLEMANQVLNETEQIAQDSAAMLRKHSEQMKHIQDKLYDVESEVKEGRKTVNRMSRPAIVNLFMK